MARTPEQKTKQRVTTELHKHGVYMFFPATHGYGRSGVPDIVGCYQGTFIAIECKAGKNTPTALQLRELSAIREAGGRAVVVNEESAHKVWELLWSEQVP